MEQAVPIGTKLQLRASINTDSGKTNFILKFSNIHAIKLVEFFAAWKYVKLVEVTMSPDPKDGYARGHIKLVTNG